MGMDNGGSNADGAQGAARPGGRLGLFAVVIYVPDPLGRFLDELRMELVSGCRTRAHVSVLPPRPLAVDWRIAREQSHVLAESWTPFEIEASSIEVFASTSVVYLQIGAGADDLHRMHDAMNIGSLAFQEPFPYHPHITLAQDIPHDSVPAVRDLAARRWEAFRAGRRFRAERLVFVRNTVAACWKDLAEFSLGTVAVR
jgi:2'-5' RNA ligase superfamily